MPSFWTLTAFPYSSCPLGRCFSLFISKGVEGDPDMQHAFHFSAWRAKCELLFDFHLLNRHLPKDVKCQTVFRLLKAFHCFKKIESLSHLFKSLFLICSVVNLQMQKSQPLKWKLRYLQHCCNTVNYFSSSLVYSKQMFYTDIFLYQYIKSSISQFPLRQEYI